jgi:phosphate transport system permease protein
MAVSSLSPTATAPASAPQAAPRSRHTRVVRRQQRIAKAIIWAAAGLTMGILLLIVGYIVVNGFYTRETRVSDVLPFAEREVPTGAPSGPAFTVLSPRSLRLEDVTYQELRTIFNGQLAFLGYLTGQNRNATPILYRDANFVTAVESYLFADGLTFEDYGVTPRLVASPEELQPILEAEDGAIAIVPADWDEAVSRGRVVGVRQTMAVVHPGVVELQAGRRLTRVDEATLRRVLNGNATAWGDIGGPAIEIRPADIAAGDPGLYEPLAPVVVRIEGAVPGAPGDGVLGDGQGYQISRAIAAADADDFLATIAATPGAVGLLRAREALAADVAYLQVDRVRHRANLRPSTILRPPSRAGAVGGLSYIIINTVVMVLFVLSIATPIGVAAAIYLVEYARQGPLLFILRIGTDTLAGIPSIIFGLFGMVFFSEMLGLQTGLLAGSLTLTIMILPTIVRTSEEALKSVPSGLREGSLSLGATRFQTIMRVVLPAASPGILTGVILAIGRAVGETAALLFTMGSNLAVVRSLNSPMRVLSVHLYLLIRENISIPNAFAAATILVFIVFVVNFATTHLVGRLNRSAGM